MSVPLFYIGGTYLLASGSDRCPTYKEVRVVGVDPDDGALLYGEVTNEETGSEIVSFEKCQLRFAVSAEALDRVLGLAALAPAESYLDELRNLEEVSHVRFVPSATSEYSSPHSSRVGYMPFSTK